MLTKEQIREAACETVQAHGMLLVHELKKGDNFDGGNLVALLEIFGAQVADVAARSVEGPTVAKMLHAAAEAVDAAHLPPLPTSMPRPEGWDEGYREGIKVCAMVVQAATWPARG